MAIRLTALVVLALLVGCTEAYTTKKTEPAAPTPAPAAERRDIRSRENYNPKLVQHLKGSAFGPTKTGYYSAELVIKPNPPVVGTASAHLIIHNYNAVDLPGLTITAKPYNRGSGKPSSGAVAVKDAGRGLYILSNIVFDAPGPWEMRLTIAGPAKTDTITLELPEVQ